MAEKTYRLHLAFHSTGMGPSNTIVTAPEPRDFLVAQLTDLNRAKQAGSPFMLNRANGELLGLIDAKAVQYAFILQDDPTAGQLIHEGPQLNHSHMN